MTEEQTREKNVEYLCDLLIEGRRGIGAGKLRLHKKIFLFTKEYDTGIHDGLDQDYSIGEQHFYFKTDGNIGSMKHSPGGGTEKEQTLDFHSFITEMKTSLLPYINLNISDDPIGKLEEILGIQGE